MSSIFKKQARSKVEFLQAPKIVGLGATNNLKNSRRIVDTVGNSAGVIQVMWVTRRVIHRAAVSTIKDSPTF
jgi:hypothetical protein